MKKKQIGKVFPSLNTTLAYYSPTSFFVTLNTVNEAEYQTLFNPPLDKNKSEQLSILIHELRHHLDHISTLWGQRHILKLHKAVNARIEHNEFEFHQILPLKIEERQFHYETYYSVETNVIPWKNSNDNWKWQLSSGVKFDINGIPDESKPILFINFATQAELHLVRVPLSIAALLETSAIRDELHSLYRHIQTLKQDEALVEREMLKKKVFSEIIYNQKLAVYNSIVHLTANILNLNDLILSLNISAAIATLCLNLPSDLIAGIPINKVAIETWKERNQKMMENHEYGFIFYNLLFNYTEFYKQDNGYNLSRLLVANNLPTKEELLSIVNNSYDLILHEIKTKRNFQTQFVTILMEGKRLFNLRGLDGSEIDTFELLEKHNYKPNVICNDTDFPLEEYKINTGLKLPMDNLTNQQWYSFAMTIDDRFNEFFEIRGL